MLLTTLLAAAISFVNPFVGTDFHGHTFPGATAPFGMIQLSPDTRPNSGDWDGCSGYHWSDTKIYGFSHTHLSGTGCDDLCDVLMMPVTGLDKPVTREKYASEFSHDREAASPGYYEVWLEKPQVQVKLTAGRRIGVHQYTYRKGVTPQVEIDLSHRDVLLEGRLEQVGDNAVQGLRRSRSWADDQSVYFYIEFDRPITSLVQDGSRTLITFAKARTLTSRVGISSVSEANAKANLESERTRTFNQQRRKTEKAWEAFLTKLKLPAPGDQATSADKPTTSLVNTTTSQKATPPLDPATFYTALYHCAIHPSLYSDVNGEYRGMDNKIHKAVTEAGHPFERYTIFSLWDTFRGLHPLLCELEPERTADFINSFISIYKECGKLPVWELWGNETNCMIGYNSAPVIADAIHRGITGFSVEEAFEALLASSKNPSFGMASFCANGCVLADEEHESVSKTLEYAYDDWCVAQVAKYLGRDKEYQEYMTSAQYWRNLFDPETGFMCARMNGHWVMPFDPTEVNNHYTEANSWQYSFFVPQDIAGLVEALGGREKFLQRIEALFTASEQTSGRHQVDITGQIGQYAHGNEPSHHIAWLPELLGDRDMTQKYVQQILTTLYTSEPDGICGNDDCGQTSAWYVLSALDRYPVCPGADLKTMTSMEKTIVTNPVFKMDSDSFVDSLTIAVDNIDKGATAYVSIDGQPYEPYDGPFTITRPCSVKAYTMMPDGRKSFTVTTTLHQAQKNIAVTIINPYDPMYSAGGDDALIDGIRGGVNWKAGGWQGYQGDDFEVIVDLLATRHVNGVKVGFCQDARSWIWMPREVTFQTSTDGENWTLKGKAKNTVDPQDYTLQMQDLGIAINADTRYIKVHATQFGIIPQWHPGAGGRSYVFVDEIVVD